jgi:CRISPR system Cascade subunit CasE
MYLSHLLIDVGVNPDRPRPGRIWLRNLYHVHQRLCMAFPSASRLSQDPDYLKPFKPEDFGGEQVHVRRKAESGFLFRIDPGQGGRAIILVQSAVEPNWEYAFHNSGYLLAAPVEKKPFDPRFEAGQRLRFRLLANPTRRLSSRSAGPDGEPVKSWANEKGIGKRVPVPVDKLSDWLARRAAASGFSIDADHVNIQPGYHYVNKNGTGRGTRLRFARYDGVLKVTDPARLCEAVITGIGSAKAFGFGLLSVAKL